jgi:hypothetical protein
LLHRIAVAAVFSPGSIHFAKVALIDSAESEIV